MAAVGNCSLGPTETGGKIPFVVTVGRQITGFQI